MAVMEIDDGWCNEMCIILLSLLTILFLNAFQIKEQTSNLWIVIKFCLLFPIIICMIAITLILYPILLIYRTIIWTKLKIKLGKKFYGLLSGLDVPVTHPLTINGMVGVLMVVEVELKTNRQSLFESVKEFVNENLLNNVKLSKLRTTIRSYGGYSYLETINLNADDCVHKLPITDGVLDDTALTKLLGNCQYEPFIGPSLWDVMVGTQPLHRGMGTAGNTKRYPIMIRFHHAIADGVTVIQLLAGAFCDAKNIKEAKVEKLPTTQDYLLMQIFQLLGKIVCLVLYLPSILYSLALIKSDVNNLHLNKLGSNENVALGFDEDGTYFRKVKNIKTITGSTFPEIICTAYSESLKNHIEKYNIVSNTRHTTLLLPVVHSTDEIQKMRNASIGNIALDNKFGVITLALPFSITNGKNCNNNLPLYSRLIDVRKRTNVLRRTMEFYISQLLFHIIAPSFPGRFLFYFAYFVSNTSIVSLIPGIPKSSYCNGKLVVSDCIFWTPHLMMIDLSFGSFSYDNRLLLSFNCDFSYMSREMAQELLNDVYKNIDLLERELEFLRKEEEI